MDHGRPGRDFRCAKAPVASQFAPDELVNPLRGYSTLAPQQKRPPDGDLYLLVEAAGIEPRHARQGQQYRLPPVA